MSKNRYYFLEYYQHRKVVVVLYKGKGVDEDVDYDDESLTDPNVDNFE